MTTRDAMPAPADDVIPALPWREILVRTWREIIDDNCLDVAAQLSYFFFLALFPAVIVLLAIASFFPLQALTDDLGRVLGPIVSHDVLQMVQDQMRRLGDADSGGVLTLGMLGALWSSSAALVSIVKSVNVAYDLAETRPWWKVRAIAIALTTGLAVLFIAALTLVVVGPDVVALLGRVTGLDTVSSWAWAVFRWPIAFALLVLAFGVIYYFAPDAEQDWVWVSPGAVVGATLWLAGSFGMKVYVGMFTDYEAAYGTAGVVIVILTWFYVSSLTILVGAELNAEIERAAPHAQPPGVRLPNGRRALGSRARRAFGAPAIPEAADVPAVASPPGARPYRPVVLALAAVAMVVAWRQRHSAPVD